MCVLAVQAERELVGVRLANHVGAGFEQLLHDRRSTSGGRVRPQPVGATETRAMTLDVVDILRGKRQTTERAFDARAQSYVCVSAKRIQRIVGYRTAHARPSCSSSFW